MTAFDPAGDGASQAARPAKLSPAQERAMVRFRAGETVQVWWLEDEAAFWILLDGSASRANIATIRILVERRLIAPTRSIKGAIVYALAPEPQP